MAHKRWLVLIAAGAVIGLLGWGALNLMTPKQTDSPPRKSTIIIDDRHLFRLTVAQTALDQVKGLSGVKSLEPDEGMYFPRDPEMPASFWMKDMLIPIDILWLKNGRIIGIEHQVPVPDASLTDGELPTYSPSEAGIDGVLEIAGGRSAELGLEAGQKVELNITK